MCPTSTSSDNLGMTPAPVASNFRDAGGGGRVRQDGDTLTMELPGLDAKRGRGRPRKPDALTAAQRAKRYRDRQKAAAAAREAVKAAWKYKHLQPHPGRVLAIKYRGPNGETWTGRGLMPRWVTHAMESGYTLADLEALANGRT